MAAQGNTITVTVQTGDFDPVEQETLLRGKGHGVGAIATFTGYVRADGGVSRMQLEHYPGMTEKSITAIAEQACGRWQLLAVRVIHRVGLLQAGDRIVYVGIASAHRGDSFAACEFIMDYLKTRAPFWKKEYSAQGEHWVEARQSDNDAASRW